MAKGELRDNIGSFILMLHNEEGSMKRSERRFDFILDYSLIWFCHFLYISELKYIKNTRTILVKKFTLNGI